MQIWTDLKDQKNFHGSTLTIGNFDGLHLGHRALLNKLKEGSKPHVLITFDPHPAQVLRPEQGLKRLFPREDLHEQLPHLDVDLLIVLKFTQAMAKMSAEEFLSQLLIHLKPSAIVVGYDFAFGHARQGHLDFLEEWCRDHKIKIEVIEPVVEDGAIFSSRKIREQISQGDVAEAARWLTRPFYLRGEVVSGAGRGRGIGFPTLNLIQPEELVPKSGVYVTRVRWKGQIFPSVTNIGTNPTFESGNVQKIETHLLVEGGPGYGERVDIEFIDRLRDEQKFANALDLKKQIEQDILKAKNILGIKI